MRTIPEDLEATFVPGTCGRDGALALWGPSLGPDDTDERLDLVVPVGTQVRARSVPVELVSVADIIDHLATLPGNAPATSSVRAWAVATRIALDLIARGRLQPTISDLGVDIWRLGPLDPTDHDRVDRLVAALPAAAHAIEVPDTSPRQIVAAQPTVSAFLDAVADSFVRTPAAALAAGHEAFAAPLATDLSPWRDWLRSTTTGTDATITAALRVQVPDRHDEDVDCVLEVHSRIDPGLVLTATDLWGAPAAVAARFGHDVDLQLLVTLRRAAQVWGPIRRLLDDAMPDRLVLDDEEANELFGPIADDLAAAGLVVMWPSDVLRPLDLRPVVTTPRPDSVGGAGLNLTTLAEMRWRATLDGDDLTDAELALLAEAKRPMVRIRGQWVRADPDQLRRLRERRSIRTGDALAAALAGDLTIDGEVLEAEIDGPLVHLAERLQSVGVARDHFEIPPGLVAQLRPYQERGVAWLVEMTELGLGGVLADDMGLGKTVQVLALHLARRGRGPTLIVCPTTLLGNWQREAARFTPDVTVRRHHGSARSLADLADDEIVVTTYGLVRRDADELAAVDWGLVVADEAQAVKNPFARTARALRSIPAPARVALTGTPVENRLVDLWALLDWTTPGLLGSLDAFQRGVAVPIERDRDPDVTERLASVVKPFLLRRRKSDPEIAPDLPEKTETDRFVGLTTEQATLYRAVLAELMDEVADADGIGRRGMVLKLLTALKQICNHPAHYLGQAGPLRGRSGKLDAATDLIQVITDEDDSVLVFTQYVAMGHLLSAHLDSVGIPSAFLHGSVPVGAREAMVDAFQDGRPRVLVVSLKAGGTGLNLTRATHVIHYDRWWNPAVEDQASDRAWRIGQHRPVQVHRMVSEGTLEERIAALLESKRSLADSVVGGGEAWITELSDHELAALVELGQNEGD